MSALAEPERDSLWRQLTSFSDCYTCYSAAVATWAAYERADWPNLVSAGLWLTLVERPDSVFGFAHFPPRLRAKLGLVRQSATDLTDALHGVMDELRRSGRVIIAADGFHLPWHVAFNRRHVPHWYVLVDAEQGPTVLDPFACRNELGLQLAHATVVNDDGLASLLGGLPGDDPVLELRESLSLGDQAERLSGGWQWFVAAEVTDVRAPRGLHGPSAVRRLAQHFREHGQDPRAYLQADDIWSIARHRAFMCRHVASEAGANDDAALGAWTEEHAVPLAKRWGHMAPLLMQASLSLRAGRPASGSVADTLERLAEQERAAALLCAANSFTIQFKGDADPGLQAGPQHED